MNLNPSILICLPLHCSPEYADNQPNPVGEWNVPCGKPVSWFRKVAATPGGDIGGIAPGCFSAVVRHWSRLV